MPVPAISRRRAVMALSAVLVLGLMLVVWLRRPDPPRYLQIKKGMTREAAEQILGRPAYGTFLTASGKLQKLYADDGGRVRVTIDDDDVVVGVEYLPDQPDPGIYVRIARYLRL